MILLTEEEIIGVKALDGWSPAQYMTLSKMIAKAQLKKLVGFLKENATFMEWEWEDSKGVWDIVIDDITWQELIKGVDDA